MTNAAYALEIPFEHLVLMLQAREEFYARLKIAGEDWVSNYNWRCFNKRPTVILLDFDVIGLSISAARDTIGLGKDLSFSKTETIIGPKSLRFWLSQLKDFTLPPGAMFELLSWKEKLTGQLGAAAKQFYTQLPTTAKSSASPAQIVKSTATRENAKLVVRELESVASCLDDLTLLETIQKNAIPLEDLLGPAPPETNDVFDFANQVLTHKRKQVPRSNYADALNVCVVSWLFNSPKLNRTAPMLVSRTKSVINFANHQESFLLPRKDDLRMFADEMFLMLDAGLRNFSEGNDRIAMDAAEQVSFTADTLRRHYRDVRLGIGRTPGEHVRFNISPRWLALKIQQENFDMQFGDILAPTSLRVEHDRASFRNSLCTPQVREMLTRCFSGSEEPHNHIHRLKAEITQQLAARGILDKALEVTPEIAFDIKGDRIQLSTYETKPVDALFTFTVPGIEENDGRPLGLITCSGSAPLGTLAAGRETRITAHHKFSPQDGAIAAIDYIPGGTGGQVQLALVWLHELDVLDLWDQCIAFLTRKAGRPTDGSVTVRLFGCY
jgi:hypothetical protein